MDVVVHDATCTVGVLIFGVSVLLSSRRMFTDNPDEVTGVLALSVVLDWQLVHIA